MPASDLLPEDDEIRLLYPRLSFHYGLSFNELIAMPRWAVMTYAEGLPQILAEEQLSAFAASTYPHMRPRDQKSLRHKLERIAQGGPLKPRNEQEFVGLLAASGITMTVEPRA